MAKITFETGSTLAKYLNDSIKKILMAQARKQVQDSHLTQEQRERPDHQKAIQEAFSASYDQNGRLIYRIACALMEKVLIKNKKKANREGAQLKQLVTSPTFLNSYLTYATLV